MDTLCASLAADSRLAAYGARHIAFLFFLPISGTSFTMAHYADDGDSFIMNTAACTKPTPQSDGEAESPGDPTPTRSCICSARPTCMRAAATLTSTRHVSYVADTYPGDIMLSTYEDDGSPV